MNIMKKRAFIQAGALVVFALLSAMLLFQLASQITQKKTAQNEFSQNEIQKNDPKNEMISGKVVYNIPSGVFNPDNIIPKPKNTIVLSGTAMQVDSTWKILYVSEGKDAADYLKEKTSTGLTTAAIGNGSSIPERSIVIGNPNTNNAIAQLASTKGISMNYEIK